MISMGAMDLGLRGRPALVAAASRGLGRACAEALAREGAAVAVCSRDRRAVEAAATEISESTGARVVPVVADVARAEDAARFVREGAEALGGCQILVTNAGGPPTGRAVDAADEDWQQALDLNFLSAVRMCREALPRMREAGYGRVVAITSLVVKQPDSSLALSTAARLATTGFLRNLAGEVAGDGITVNAVLPSAVLTARTRELAERRARRGAASPEDLLADAAAEVPVGRMGDPAEVGDLVAFLASERAGFLTGCTIQVDGGLYRGVF